MEIARFEDILKIGETICVEFKRCGNGIENDVFESVCSFLNRFGGDIFMGVEDDGTVRGVPDNAVRNMIKNFISCVSNPVLMSPTVYLEPNIIAYYGKTVIHVHVYPSAEVHSYKKEIFDRVDDADVHVTATAQIAQMYIRKQNIFTEKKIYPYVTLDDLRLDMLPTIRQMATNMAGGTHPWQNMGDKEVLRSAGLYGKDRATGESGYNLAAVLLLGKDDVIMNVAPTYETDALLRKVNIDRYDDREVVHTNLIDSYDRLMAFGQKHLPDPFYLEGDTRISLRNILLREMISNTLIHREFSSAYAAKFVIEAKRMFVENANRASWTGLITPENFEPVPKNPIIANFFRTIGRADKLGSGVRNMFKYGKSYGGSLPTFEEKDIFRISLSLEEVLNATVNPTDQAANPTDQDENPTDQDENPTDQAANPTDEINNEIDVQIIGAIINNPKVSFTELALITGKNRGTIAVHIKRLAEQKIIARRGNNKKGHWEIIK